MKNFAKASIIVLFILLLALSVITNSNGTLVGDTFETHETSNATVKLYAGSSANIFETLSTAEDLPISYIQYDTDIVASANNAEEFEEELEIVDDEEVNKEPEWETCDKWLYASTPLNVRSYPNPESELVGIYGINADVHVIGQLEDSNWVQVNYNNTIAYVHSDYLSYEKQKTHYLGTYRVTGYDACIACCGSTSGITASGTHVQAGRTIAMYDVPFGTKVLINGHEYIVEDRGSAIGPGCVDIYFNTHAEAAQFAVQYLDVSIILD